MAYYSVEFTYPGGKVEELFDQYDNLEDAIEFGTNLLGQVGANSKYRDRNKDIFEEEIRVSPFFVVVKHDENGRQIVYQSKR